MNKVIDTVSQITVLQKCHTFFEFAVCGLDLASLLLVAVLFVEKLSADFGLITFSRFVGINNTKSASSSPAKQYNN
jgi:hypothetical protein